MNRRNFFQAASALALIGEWPKSVDCLPVYGEIKVRKSKYPPSIVTIIYVDEGRLVTRQEFKASK